MTSWRNRHAGAPKASGYSAFQKTHRNMHHQPPPLRSRARWAFGIIAALAFVLVLVDGLGQLAPLGKHQSTQTLEAFESTSTSSTLQMIDRKIEALPTELPASFTSEVLSLRNCSDLYGSPQAGVVGFTVEGSADRAFKRVSSELVSGGWHAIKSGTSTCGSFVKDRGLYRWAFVSCVEMNGTTSVVVQVVPEKEEGEQHE